jgi:hypothetical protein
MTQNELVRKIIFITGAVYAEKQIRDAVEAYSKASNGAKPIVSGALPDVEQIERHIRTHNPYPLGKQNNVDWSNGFERGVAWIIGMLSGNDR